jgi:HEAT repeat protein
MAWHKANEKFNSLTNQLFHGKEWQERSEAARELGIMKEGRAVNLLCRALRSEQDKVVQDRIIEALGKIGDGRATLRITEKLKEMIERDNIEKFRVINIIESLINIKDKRALVFIGPFLNNPEEEVRKVTENAFDIIEPNWREIIKKEKETKTIQDIFKIKI